VYQDARDSDSDQSTFRSLPNHTRHDIEDESVYSEDCSHIESLQNVNTATTGPQHPTAPSRAGSLTESDDSHYIAQEDEEYENVKPSDYICINFDLAKRHFRDIDEQEKLYGNILEHPDCPVTLKGELLKAKGRTTDLRSFLRTIAFGNLNRGQERIVNVVDRSAQTNERKSRDCRTDTEGLAEYQSIGEGLQEQGNQTPTSRTVRRDKTPDRTLNRTNLFPYENGIDSPIRPERPTSPSIGRTLRQTFSDILDHNPISQIAARARSRSRDKNVQTRSRSCGAGTSSQNNASQNQLIDSQQSRNTQCSTDTINMSDTARAITLSHLHTFMPEFTGRGQSGRAHWRDINLTAETHGITDQNTLIPFLKRSLKEQAQIWYKGYLRKNPQSTNDQFLAAFLTEFTKLNDKAAYNEELLRLRMKKNQTLQEFCNQIIDAATKVDRNMSEEIIISHITTGCLDQYRTELKKGKCKNLDELKEHVKLLDQIYFHDQDPSTIATVNLITSSEFGSKIKELVGEGRSNGDTSTTRSDADQKIDKLTDCVNLMASHLTDQIKEIQDVQCKTNLIRDAGQPEQNNQYMQQPQRRQFPRNADGNQVITCNYCSKIGHKYRECRKRLREQSQNQSQNQNQNGPNRRNQSNQNNNYNNNNNNRSRFGNPQQMRQVINAIRNGTICTFCNKVGHGADRCWSNPNNKALMPAFNSPQMGNPGPPMTASCYNCTGPHLQRNCPRTRPLNPNAMTYPQNNNPNPYQQNGRSLAITGNQGYLGPDDWEEQGN